MTQLDLERAFLIACHMLIVLVSGLLSINFRKAFHMADDILNLEEQRIINLAQNVRERLVNSMIVNGQMPDDNEDRSVLLMALRDLDKSTLTTAKLRIDNKQADGMASAADIIGRLLSQAPSRRPAAALEIPEDDLVIDLVPGEIEQGITTFSYEDMVGPQS